MTKQDMVQMYQRNLEELTSQNPHAEDPRLLQANQGSHCALRYTMFSRCAKELGEEDPRCKYQYYRAQITCTAEQMDEWNEHRSRDKPAPTAAAHLPCAQLILGASLFIFSLFFLSLKPLCFASCAIETHAPCKRGRLQHAAATVS